MFDIGPAEIVVLVVAAVLLFGPEKLPDLARKAARVLAFVRNIANNAQNQLSSELGPGFENFDIRDPKGSIKRHLMEQVQPIMADVEQEIADSKKMFADTTEDLASVREDLASVRADLDQVSAGQRELEGGPATDAETGPDAGTITDDPAGLEDAAQNGAGQNGAGLKGSGLNGAGLNGATRVPARAPYDVDAT